MQKFVIAFHGQLLKSTVALVIISYFHGKLSFGCRKSLNDNVPLISSSTTDCFWLLSNL